MSAVVDEIARLFAAHGGATYGEGVTMTEHALQTAAEAEAAGADETLVAAALLHDVGHFVEPPDDAYGHHGHGEAGAAYLRRHFGPEVSEPVRLHVAAKRYLCAVEPAYARELSPASTHTLAKQGGPMDAAEAAAFEAEPYRETALALRRFDDAGKVPGRSVPGLDHYRPLLERLVRG